MPTDEELMQRVSQGDTDSLGVLFDRHHRAVFGFLHRMGVEPALAEDVTQDTFLRLLDRRGSYRVGMAFTPWLYAIARNLAVDSLRQRRRANVTSRADELADQLPDDSQPDALHVWAQAETDRLVRDAVQSLPIDLRTAIVLREYQQLSYEEVSGALGCSTGAARVRAHRARLKLRDLLAALLDDPEPEAVVTAA